MFCFPSTIHCLSPTRQHFRHVHRHRLDHRPQHVRQQRRTSRWLLLVFRLSRYPRIRHQRQRQEKPFVSTTTTSSVRRTLIFGRRHCWAVRRHVRYSPQYSSAIARSTSSTTAPRAASRTTKPKPLVTTLTSARAGPSSTSLPIAPTATIRLSFPATKPTTPGRYSRTPPTPQHLEALRRRQPHHRRQFDRCEPTRPQYPSDQRPKHRWRLHRHREYPQIFRISQPSR